jgi:mycothiol system anti-sigma-R factor
MNDEIKTIKCEEAIRMMLEYLDDELHSHDHDSMEEHLESCRSCYSRMEFEQRLKGMVKHVVTDKAPVALNQRIKKIVKGY